MNRNDWYGLGTSLLLHLLLLLVFGVMTLAATEPDPIGYVEVDFGPLAEGRPVRQAVEDQPETPEEIEQEPVDPVEEEAAPPEEAKPVELPDQPTEVIDEEEVQTPETETISPVQQSNPAEVEAPEPKPEPKPVEPLGGGRADGTTGDAEGDPGAGEEQETAAPWLIEGLNRSTVFSPKPDFPEKVNADIKVRITVDPQGRVIRTFPVLKGNPRLEQAIRDAMQRWRFNALPSNVPQENQTGTITFRFRVE